MDVEHAQSTLSPIEFPVGKSLHFLMFHPETVAPTPSLHIFLNQATAYYQFNGYTL